ncbi:hypothetical protein [Streptomyces sp. NPDC005322]|uniref:hypothetical protein n=1 Tax=Streptomyces sp. NPDC005322 TaxID=3157032 RepID=UPI0033B37A3D
MDVALAQVEAKLYDKAGDTLIEVGLDAPEWVKHQALPGVIGRWLVKVSTSKVHAIGTQLIKDLRSKARRRL